MARLFQKTIPAAGSATLIPINVCGATLISCPAGSLEVALDPSDFDTQQFYVISAGAPQVLPIGSSKTILWIRQNPLTGVPEALDLSVWTEIDYAGDY